MPLNAYAWQERANIISVNVSKINDDVFIAIVLMCSRWNLLGYFRKR